MLDVKPDVEHEAVVNEYLTRMEMMNKQMAEDQQEIEALRAETDIVLADIMRTLRMAQHY